MKTHILTKLLPFLTIALLYLLFFFLYSFSIYTHAMTTVLMTVLIFTGVMMIKDRQCIFNISTQKTDMIITGSVIMLYGITGELLLLLLLLIPITDCIASLFRKDSMPIKTKIKSVSIIQFIVLTASIACVTYILTLSRISNLYIYACGIIVILAGCLLNYKRNEHRISWLFGFVLIPSIFILCHDLNTIHHSILLILLATSIILALLDILFYKDINGLHFKKI